MGHFDLLFPSAKGEECSVCNCQEEGRTREATARCQWETGEQGKAKERYVGRQCGVAVMRDCLSLLRVGGGSGTPGGGSGLGGMGGPKAARLSASSSSSSEDSDDDDDSSSSGSGSSTSSSSDSEQGR